MFTRFEQLRRMEDLEEPITCHHNTLALRPHGHPNRSSSLSNFEVAVFTCFEQLRRMERAFEEAIIWHAKHLHFSLVAIPAHLFSIASRLVCQLAFVIREERRIWRRQSLVTEKHLLSPSQGHPDCSVFLRSLGNAMSDYFKHSDKIENLEEAIIGYREAFVFRPHSHPDRSFSLDDLGMPCSLALSSQGQRDNMLNAVKNSSETKVMYPLLAHTKIGSKRASLLFRLYVIVPKSAHVV